MQSITKAAIELVGVRLRNKYRKVASVVGVANRFTGIGDAWIGDWDLYPVPKTNSGGSGF